jgi:anthranilate phosphoribosyltransferase
VSDPIHHAIAVVARGGPLSASEAEAFMGAVLDGEVTPAQLGAVLMGLRVRGESAEELCGFVRALRARALAVQAPEGTIDVCGTGGDGRHTFNISSAAAIVVSAAGVPVAKTGNRAVSSRSGSSDAMAALGLVVEQSPDDAEASLRDHGFAYLHAPAFHPGMRHAGPVRRELGIRTAFNLCGPLANAAFPRRQLVGVPDEESASRVAYALQALGTERAWVVTGEHIDELPLDGTGLVFIVDRHGVERRSVRPADAGLPEADSSLLAGGEPSDNAAMIEAILRGTLSGPSRDVVLLNAGASLVVAGHARDLRAGVAAAARAIDSGAAASRLEALRDHARTHAARRAAS